MSETKEKAPEAAPVEEQVPLRPPSLLKLILKAPRETLLVRFLTLVMLLALGVFATSTYVFVKVIKEKNHASVPSDHEDSHGSEMADEHAEAGAPHGAEAPEEVVLGGPKIPKKVLAAQDGQMEEGHDLVEPQIEAARDIASLIKSDLKVSLGSRYVKVPEVYTSLREGRRQDGMLSLNLSFEVKSMDVQNEVERRGTEIQSMVSSMASERAKQDMLTTQGLLRFKTDLLREVNLMLGSGKISDVLVTEFNVR